MTHFDQSSVYLIDSDGRMLNLPMPSNSPRDPLNMSPWRRRGVLLSVVLYGALGSILVQTPDTLWKLLGHDFAQTDNKNPALGLLGPFRTLFTGVGVLLWTPLCLAIGRRPVMLLCSLLLIGGTAWAAVATSFASFLASICLLGLVLGAFYSVCLLITIDITFVHERPTFIAVLWSLGGIVVLTVTALSTLLVQAMGSWRLFYGFGVIPCIANFVILLCFLPETFFLRPPTAFNGKIIVQNGNEEITVYDEWYQVPGGRPPPEPESPQNVAIWGRIKNTARTWTVGGRWKAFLAFYPQLLFSIVNPLLFWVAILNVLNMGAMMTIGLMFPVVLSSAPYSLPQQTIGLVNLAGGLGALLALPAAGPIMASLTRRLTARNGGVRDAEHYLPAFILPIITGSTSIILFGSTVKFKMHWIHIYLSYMLNAFSSTTFAVANTLWVTEAFPQVAAAALAGVMGVSFMASFGISSLITPWIHSQGYELCALEIGVPILVVGLVAIPLSFWGKSARQYINGRWSLYTEGALRPQ